jgi:hypothetical protein
MNIGPTGTLFAIFDINCWMMPTSSSDKVVYCTYSMIMYNKDASHVYVRSSRDDVHLWPEKDTCRKDILSKYID